MVYWRKLGVKHHGEQHRTAGRRKVSFFVGLRAVAANLVHDVAKAFHEAAPVKLISPIPSQHHEFNKPAENKVQTPATDLPKALKMPTGEREMAKTLRKTTIPAPRMLSK